MGFTFILLFFYVSNIFSIGLAQESYLQSGPMVCHADYREVKLWVQTKHEAQVYFLYYELNSKKNTVFETATVKTNAENAYTALCIADKVLPGKRYAYELYINNKRVIKPYPFEFQTPLLWQYRTPPPNFKVALGSCNFINDPEFDRPGKPYGGDPNIFYALYDAKPDLMLWMGDYVYFREADWGTQTGMFYRYTHARSIKELQPFLASTHHYAIWDDHDYGPNDHNRSFREKKTALHAFKSFWGNPSYGLDDYDGEDLEGIMTNFLWGDAEFFLTDNRFYRSPNNRKTGERTMLGKRQIEWLLDGLKSSQATFKFVVMGGQFLNPAKFHEIYANVFPQEREQILKAIQDEKIEGVIFLNGDKHHSELSVFQPEGFYPIYDFTVSPLTSTPHEPKDEINFYRVPSSLVVEQNYGTMEFIGDKSQRELQLKLWNKSGKLLFVHSIKASELKIPKR